MEVQKVDFDDEAVEALRAEFYSHMSSADYAEMMQTLLAVSGRDMYSSSKPLKGGDLYTIRDSDTGVLIGVALNAFYAWETIKSQLYFRPCYRNGVMTGFSLARFEELLPTNCNRSVVGEFAYFLVDPKRRGQKIGSKLFDFCVEEFRSILKPGEPFFTLAKGNFVRSPIGPKLRDYLLAVERRINGIREDNSTIVTGVEVPAEQILRDLGLDVTQLTTSPKSIATESLARSRGFTHAGYSKNLSIAYIRTIS